MSNHDFIDFCRLGLQRPVKFSLGAKEKEAALAMVMEKIG